MSQPHFAAARMAGLQEYFFARANERITKVKARGVDVINLGIGNPDLPPPEKVVECLRAETLKPANHLYPSYVGLPEFRQAISEWYASQFQLTLNADTQVFPVNGSKQGIVYLTLALVGPRDEVLMPNPGYSAYEKAAVIAGATARYYPLTEQNAFLPDLQALATQDLRKVKMMWINYPHNPTGATVTEAQLKEIAEFADKNNIILVNDNPYSHIVFDGYKAPSLLQFLTDKTPFLELSSMSKTYNMPGWRIGWVAGHPELVALVKNMFSNIETGQFIPLQKAATVALSTPQSWIDERNAIYADRKKLVIKLLQKLGCRTFDFPASLYIWAELPNRTMTSEDYIFDLLEKTGIFIAPGTAFGSDGEGYIRASVCQPKEMLNQAISRL